MIAEYFVFDSLLCFGMAATAFGKPYKKTSCTPSHKSCDGIPLPGVVPLFSSTRNARTVRQGCGGSLGLAMPNARQEDAHGASVIPSLCCY